MARQIVDAYWEFLRTVRSARKRAAKKGWEFEIRKAEADALWRRCGGRCEVTGLEFHVEQMETEFQRRPYAPSLDRRDNAKGYTVDNVRVVCVAVNLAMNQWGEAVLLRIAAALFDTGAFARIGRQDTAPVVLPRDVRLYTGTKGIRFLARARDFGREDHLGTFHSVDDALAARAAWARSNSSRKVLQQIYEFTRNPELLNEINSLQHERMACPEGIEPPEA
jgi:hypothetical protein